VFFKANNPQDKSDQNNQRKRLVFPKISPKASIVLLIIMFSAGAGFVGGYYGNRSTSQDQKSQQILINKEGELISQIAKEVGPGVVSIDVQSNVSRNDNFFGRQNYSQRGAGTGFIISKEGIVVTNRHVIPQGVENVSVTLSDGTEFDDVSVVGKTNEGDPLDVAFLKINDKKDKNLVPVKLGDSGITEVGARVIAIGNALGQFQNTVTSGIISGYGRNIEAGDGNSTESLQNLFQTDAAINEGNSGGPLVNINGEVIGINTAVAGNAQSIGFAIPINDIKGLIKSVLEKGKLERPYLGVRYVGLNDDYAYQLNLDTTRGAYIFGSDSGPAVIDGSPADKAGLKEKDIITEVNGQKIDDKNSLSTVLAQQAVGDKVKLKVIRDGKEVVLEATLEAIPAEN